MPVGVPRSSQGASKGHFQVHFGGYLGWIFNIFEGVFFEDFLMYLDGFLRYSFDIPRYSLDIPQVFHSYFKVFLKYS